MNAPELAQDVASTLLVSVPRPPELLPDKFVQAVQDLEHMGFVRVVHVGAERAVLERTTPPIVLRHIVGVPDEDQESVQFDNAIALAAGDVEIVDDHTVRLRPMPKKLEAAEIKKLVVTLVAEGAASIDDLVKSPELGHIDRKSLQNAVHHCRKRGELVGTGYGTFKLASGGGRSAAPRKERASRRKHVTRSNGISVSVKVKRTDESSVLAGLEVLAAETRDKLVRLDGAIRVLRGKG